MTYMISMVVNSSSTGTYFDEYYYSDKCHVACGDKWQAR